MRRLALAVPAALFVAAVLAADALAGMSQQHVLLARG
jgi:hypothetical protein